MEGKSNLLYLDISHNRLYGGLTDCWMNWKYLVHVNLADNRLTGNIPQSMTLLSNLKSLHPNKNNLFGYITPSLQNSQKLSILNLGENKFSGNITSQSLKVLLLRANQFHGNIPPQLCQLSSLVVLELADNELSGPIPNCLHNITAFVSLNTLPEYFSFHIDVLNETLTITFSVQLLVKGQQLVYTSSQDLMRTVDLSQNNLIGTIPAKIFTLTKLQSLNLSHNQLTGKIPREIGKMKELEGLDLSYNQLEGEIPQTTSSLSFLSFLNLSFNNFTGQIPPTSQLRILVHLAILAILNYVELHLQRTARIEEKPTALDQLKKMRKSMNLYQGSILAWELGLPQAFGQFVLLCFATEHGGILTSDFFMT